MQHLLQVAPICNMTGQERRVADRRLTRATVAVLHVGDEEDFCRVRNISENGLMAHVYRDLRVGEEVRVELISGHPVKGTVVWATHHLPDLASRPVRHIGVRLDATIDVEQILLSYEVAEAGRLHRSARVNLRCDVRLSFEGRHLAGKLCNISQGGAKIRTPHGFPPGCRGSMLLREFPPLHGSVRWASGPNGGMAFDEPVGLEPLMSWIRARQAEALADALRGVGPRLSVT